MDDPRRPVIDKPHIAVLDVVPASSREALSACFEPEFVLRYATDNTCEARVEAAADASVLLVGWSPVEAPVIEAATRCRLIQKLGVGVDRIDIDTAARRGIPVLLASGINAEAVAEMTILLILAVSRNLVWAVEETRTGRFPKETLRAQTFQLLDKTVGLVGFGHIGRAVARRLGPFRVETLYYDVAPAAPDEEQRCAARYVGLDELVSRSDVISLHLPATPDNRGLVDADLLRKATPGAILVNTARGSLVDEAALAEAVRTGRLAGAGLDVTYPEPLPPSSPLRDLDRVVITPHVSGAVANNFPRVVERAHHNVRAVLDGQPVAPTDIAVWP